MDKVDNCVTQENLERIGRMTLFNDILFRNVAKDKDVARLFVRLFTGRESLVQRGSGHGPARCSHGLAHRGR